MKMALFIDANYQDNSVLLPQQANTTTLSERLDALRRRKRAAEEQLQQQGLVVKSKEELSNNTEDSPTTTSSILKKVRFQPAEGEEENDDDVVVKERPKSPSEQQNWFWNLNEDDSSSQAEEDDGSNSDRPESATIEQRYLQALRDLGQERGRRKRSSRNMLRLAQELHRVTRRVEQYERGTVVSSPATSPPPATDEEWQATLAELAQAKRDLNILKGQQSIDFAAFLANGGPPDVAELCASLLQKLGESQQQQQQAAAASNHQHQERLRQQQEQMDELERQLQAQNSRMADLQAALEQAQTVAAETTTQTPPPNAENDSPDSSWQHKCFQLSCQLSLRTKELGEANKELKVKKKAIGRLQEDKFKLQTQLLGGNGSVPPPSVVQPKPTNDKEQKLEAEVKRWKVHCQRERKRSEALARRLQALGVEEQTIRPSRSSSDKRRRSSTAAQQDVNPASPTSVVADEGRILQELYQGPTTPKLNNKNSDKPTPIQLAPMR